MRRFFLGCLLATWTASAFAAPGGKVPSGPEARGAAIERLSDRIGFLRERLNEIQLRAERAKFDGERRRLRAMEKSLMEEFRMLRRAGQAAKLDDPAAKD